MSKTEVNATEQYPEAIALMTKAMAENDSGPEGSALYDIHMQEFAGGYTSGSVAALEALLNAGWRLTPPGHMALPQDRREAEVMNVVSEAFLKSPSAKGG